MTRFETANQFGIYLKGKFNLLRLFLIPSKDQLNWPVVLRLSFKNLLNNRSRTVITVGGMGVGVGAIVFLLSFVYGLQAVVTNRLLWPEALRSAEVTSDSAQVKLDKDMLERIRGINGVVGVHPVVRLAGRIKYRESQTDVVVVSGSDRYIKLSNIPIIAGQNLSLTASQPWQFNDPISLKEKLNQELEGQVAGVSTASALVEDGDFVTDKGVEYRVKGGGYVPVYVSPSQKSKIVGYLEADLLKTYRGYLVWGGVYDDIGGQGRQVLTNGQIKGKWLKSNVPLWKRIDNLVYEPITDDTGSQVKQSGYLTLVDIYLLTSIDKRIDKLIDAYDQASSAGEVLGTATASSDVKELTDSSVVAVGTSAAQLIDKIAADDQSINRTQEATEITVAVKTKPENHQALINEVLLRAWGVEPGDIIGQTMVLEYVVTSSLLPSLTGRVLSDEIEYQIVGVVRGGKKALVYTPLADVESMGVKTYSSAKVLVDREDNLPLVRDIIRSLGLTSVSISDTLHQINRLFKVIRFLLAAFGSVALLIALFGMFNTLTVSLLERTREIGIMKSLGTTNIDVWRLFISESLIISFFGAVLGVCLGAAAEVAVDKFIFHFSQKANTSFWILPLDLIILVIILTLLVGLLTGWYPARRAAKISALDAIRYE